MLMLILTYQLQKQVSIESYLLINHNYTGYRVIFLTTMRMRMDMWVMYMIIDEIWMNELRSPK